MRDTSLIQYHYRNRYINIGIHVSQYGDPILIQITAYTHTEPGVEGARHRGWEGNIDSG